MECQITLESDSMEIEVILDEEFNEGNQDSDGVEL